MPLQHVNRPTSFDAFYGNADVISSLQAALSREDDIPHAFFISGPPGIGKTTLAHIICEHLNISPASRIVYNSANTRGIDTMREITEDVKYPPLFGDAKMYILDEFHSTTGPAQEALLLPLENVPKHSFFAICTTEPNKIKVSIKRRCHILNLKAATEKELNKFLLETVVAEGIPVEDFAEVIAYISRNASGSYGVALSLLDTVIDLEDTKEALRSIRSTAYESDPETIELCRAILKRDWQTAAAFLKTYQGDVESARYSVMNYLSATLLNSGKSGVAEQLALFVDPFINAKKAGLVLATYMAING